MALSVPLSDLEKRLASAGPNARRMARGLGPLPPTRRRPFGAKRATTSSTPVSCTTKTTVCCASLESSVSPVAVSALAAVNLSPTSPNVGATIGLACVIPITAILGGSKSCPSTATVPASCCSTLLGLVGLSCTATTLTV
ncbi:hypothetical protein C8R46DRAFT_1229016 [Mycena filopes]|nr:hypothetical protein C8R46DRAFT_1229016 [Mycena filopes]